MADVLCFKENLTFGKHIIATEDISVNECIMIATPFATIEHLIHTSPGCFECGKISKFQIHCPHCIDVWFCSNPCKTSTSHQIKCDQKFNRNDCQIIRLAVEVITVACNAVSDIATLLEFGRGLLYSNKRSEKCRPPYSQYSQILTLKGSPEYINGLKARLVVKHILQLPKVRDLLMDIEEKKRIFFNLAYRHVNSYKLNVFEEHFECSKDGAFVKTSIFDTLSRFNHSCDPNIFNYIDDDDTTYCVAIRPIKTNEQLFINYLGEIEFETNAERREYIKDNWNFDCKCKLCQQ